MSLISSVYYDFRPYMQLDDFDIRAENNAHQKFSLRAMALKVLETMSLSMGFSRERSIDVSISADPMEFIPRTTVFTYKEESGVICLPALVFFDALEIPFNGADDPELRDLKKLQEFVDRVSDAFFLNKKKVTLFDSYRLSLYLKFLEDPERAKKALKFTLGHELGHLFYHHVPSKKTTLFKIMNIFFLGIPTIIRNRQNREKERQADFFSYSHSVEFAEGGIYIFQVLETTSQKAISMRLIHLFLKASLALTHTSFKARLESIQTTL